MILTTKEFKHLFGMSVEELQDQLKSSGNPWVVAYFRTDTPEPFKIDYVRGEIVSLYPVGMMRYEIEK